MADIKINNTRSVSGGSLTVADLRALINGVNGSCRVRVDHYRGTNQFDPSTTTITITDVEPERITRSSGDRPMDTL